ncbi:MAG: 23S rRNA (uracil(1939)-C(5))-methyltransferase RlmD [Oscillospiraceae bacterium]|jgi:23S rRNA (uracil1939-C5)-methyltransferase|nr:23S rRNA (uracil(1939)-C(5))-methyltransferase RlmD [Oscillospiraceae bacterium]
MPELKKNDLLTLNAESYSSEGQGVAHSDGRVLFVKGALRGETVEARVLKVTAHAAFAKTERVVAPSPHRITPDCPHFGKCGGCDFLHMDYAEELFCKRQRVEDALRRIGGLTLDVPDVVPSPELFGYRNKAIVEVARHNGRAVTGCYRAHSHDVVAIESCPIQSDVSNRLAAALRAWMDAVPEESDANASNAKASELVRYLFCRTARDSASAQAVVVSPKRKLPDEAGLIKTLRAACPELTGILLMQNDGPGNVALTGNARVLWGEKYLTDTLGGLRFKLSPRSFYQVNHAQAERLYSEVTRLAALTRADTALDLYSGAGTISLTLARDAGRVIGAEIIQDAVKNARENARSNESANTEFLLADAGDALVTLTERGIRPAAVVFDPPRRGLAPEVIDAAAKMSPERVVYVSCDPATLARDLGAFRELGYLTREVRALDMFPRCTHVECAALLTRG